ncbi:head maturation protease, ClpP-related [Agrobacterium pusense]|uniref:ATP-dependent Clp protease proteolytic subunit n=1 Tax=Agrobacterium pusense TaxID=648995 RepID=A0AA44J162_9HYPH|nr:head maturation protease, ClpP-related [Agrobacterium pusense]NRF10856.1 Clp protease ClpP [Agrobacterium pusense]NRF21566.1 Clp protease ClpP [Agrobacterium pusense]
MSAFVSNGKLYLNGMVGDYTWFTKDCFTFEDVMTALDQTDRSKKLTVHVNSAGGDAIDGAAIYSALAALPNGVDIVIEGIAASAGSLIAMAGKTVTMTSSAVMMIHDVMQFTDGNSDDHKRALSALEAMSNVYAGVYAAKSKKSVTACRNLMKAETWFEPDQAVAAGFADKVSGPGARGLMVAAFDYSLFQHAPKKLVDLAAAKNWKAETKSPVIPKEKTMTNTPAATARAEAAARIKAIMMHAEAEGRTALAEHLAYETDMDPEEAVKMLALAGKAAPEPTMTYEQRRLAGHGITEHDRRRAAAMPEGYTSAISGLARPDYRGGGDPKASGLVANMKRRNGIK